MAYDGVDEEILQDFIVEASELIETLNEQLVQLEALPIFKWAKSVHCLLPFRSGPDIMFMKWINPVSSPIQSILSVRP